MDSKLNWQEKARLLTQGDLDAMKLKRFEVVGLRMYTGQCLNHRSFLPALLVILDCVGSPCFYKLVSSKNAMASPCRLVLNSAFGGFVTPPPPTLHIKL